MGNAESVEGEGNEAASSIIDSNLTPLHIFEGHRDEVRWNFKTVYRSAFRFSVPIAAGFAGPRLPVLSS